MRRRNLRTPLFKRNTCGTGANVFSNGTNRIHRPMRNNTHVITNMIVKVDMALTIQRAFMNELDKNLLDWGNGLRKTIDEGIETSNQKTAYLTLLMERGELPKCTKEELLEVHERLVAEYKAGKGIEASNEEEHF